MTELSSQQKKAYLQRYRRIAQRIDRRYAEIAEWYDKAGLKAMEYTDMPKANNGSNQLEIAVEGILEIERQLRDELTELAKLRENIEKAILSVKDDTLRLLLELRYIDGKTFEETAVEMNYTYQWVCELHGRALKQLIVIDI